MPLALLILAAALLASFVADAADVNTSRAQALLQKHDCYICHADRDARTGPAFIDIADRYRGKPNAAARLAAVVRKGAHGNAPWPMPPLPQVPAADARKMVAYILGLK